jgi:hypothetical protein
VKGVAVAAAFRATVSALLLYVADPALQPGLSLTGQGVGLYYQVMPRGIRGSRYRSSLRLRRSLMRGWHHWS